MSLSARSLIPLFKSEKNEEMYKFEWQTDRLMERYTFRIKHRIHFFYKQPVYVYKQPVLRSLKNLATFEAQKCPVAKEIVLTMLFLLLTGQIYQNLWYFKQLWA